MILRHLVETDVITGPEEECISKRQQSIEITFPWNRVYNRQFLLDNNLWFNDLYGGDVIHTILAVNVCNRIKNEDAFYYLYRVDNYSSDTHSTQTAEKIFNMSFVLAQAVDNILPEIKPEWKNLVAECAPWRVNASVKGILKLSHSELKRLYELLHENKELYQFIKRVGNRNIRFILEHPLLTRLMSVIYKTAYKIKS